MSTDPQYGASLYPADECKALRHRLFINLADAERFYNDEVQRLKTLQEYWNIVLWRSVYHPEGAAILRHAEYNGREEGAPAIKKEEQGRLW